MAFVCAMERVLDVYKQPIGRHYPVICMDESSVQCVREVQEPWPNMAECEFSVLSRQCLNRRLADIKAVRREVTAWTISRNQVGNTVDWRFTTEDARIKLKTLYPCTGKDQAMMDIAC